MKNTTFIINGGLGRVISSISALEKYHRLNPNDDFKILVPAWIDVFTSNPTLQHRVFDLNVKGTFENYIKNNNVVCPEPYHLNSFFNEEKQLYQAFDEIINCTDDHSDLQPSKLYLNDLEIANSGAIINSLKQQYNKSKVVIFQPYGSAAQIVDSYLVDHTNRSLETAAYLKLSELIQQNDTLVIYASDGKLFHQLDKSLNIDAWQPYIRTMMSFMYHSDLFVGCDSSGQHIARGLDKKGVIIAGGTNENIFSYPDFFDIFRKSNIKPTFSPWRLSDIDVSVSDRMNDGIMEFSKKDIDSIYGLIEKNLKNSVKSNENISCIAS